MEIAIGIVLGIAIGIAIGIAVGIVWKSVTLRLGNPLGPSLTTSKNPLCYACLGNNERIKWI